MTLGEAVRRYQQMLDYVEDDSRERGAGVVSALST
jgi:hypothetical protein